MLLVVCWCEWLSLTEAGAAWACVVLRKDVTREEVTVHVCLFAFDLLYLNGESLVKRPFIERRQL
jgi:hypothetical protein